MVRNRIWVAVVLAAAMVFSAAFLPLGQQAQAQESDELTSQSIDSDAISERLGLVDPRSGVWHLRGQGGAVNSFFFGNPGDYPFAGDWDCDGDDTPGLYRQSDGFVYLRNSNTQGVADIRFFFGNPGDIPLAGDFNGDGCDTVSIYRPSEARIYVINKLGANDGGLGAADFSYIFGNPGDKPFVGDFNGDGFDTVGLHRESTGFVYFRNSNTQGIADNQFFFGNPGDRLVAGDWGIVDDVDTPAVFRPSQVLFYLRYTNTQGIADEQLSMGEPAMLPVAGWWTAKLGVSGALAKGIRGVPYFSQVNAIGQTPPFTITKTSGPAWATVSNSGVVTGTPTDVGTFNLGVTVQDGNGQQTTQNVPVTVQDGCDSNTTMPDSQCLALVSLYVSTQGWNWFNKANWFQTEPCSWFGVFCDDDVPIVVDLDLSLNNLAGPIPDGIGALVDLDSLDLSQNALAGPIPNGIGALVNLELLDLSVNALDGAIPAGVSGLVSLDTIDLAENGLDGPIPPQLAGIATLTEVFLSSNTLSGAIPAFAGPIELFESSDNGHTGFPDWLATKPNLEDVNLANNPLGGSIPVGMASLLLLDDVNLANTGIGGTIPAFVSINELILSGNSLDGTIPILPAGMLTLRLDNNLLDGPLPDPFPSALTTLHLNNNELSGAVPDSIINLVGIPDGQLALCLGNPGPFSGSAVNNAFMDAKDPGWDATLNPPLGGCAGS